MNELTKMAVTLAPKVEFSQVTLKIAEALDKHRMVYLTGKAGSGKSYNIKALSKYYKSVAVTATTGIAAIGIGGETFHSFLCIDILETLSDLKKSDEKNKYTNRFKDMQQTLFGLDLLIIDEVSMLNKEQLRMVLYRIKDFPNIRLLLVGDFPQLKAVTGRPLYISKIFTENFFCIKLRKNHRQKDDLEFQAVLDEVRNACPSNKTLKFLKGLENNVIEGSVKLRARNKTVDEINETELAKIKTEPIICYRKITYKNPKVDKYVLDGLLSGVREPEVFLFKVGARVMITRNSKKFGIYNGDLATVVEGSSSTILKVQLDRNSRVVSIPVAKNTINITLGGRKVVAVEYTAFNAIIAYAITIHKSQGLTLDKADIDCEGLFDRHMFYVALSRATSSKGVQLHNTDHLEFRRNTKLSTKWYVK